MANITRDTHDDSKNYHKVVAQRAEARMDNEYNEQADIATTRSAEIAAAVMTGKRATQEGLLENMIPWEAKGDDLAPFATGTANIFLKAGALYVEGFRYIFSTDVDLGAQANVVLEAVPSADTYGFIYVDISQKEISSGDDPNIATPQLGETTRRETLQLTFRNQESGVDFATAFAAITAGAPVAGDRLWKGNTARVIVCRYFRLSGVAAIANTDLFDSRQPTPSELLTRQIFGICNRQKWDPGTDTWSAGVAEGGAGSDGMIIWSRLYSKLIIGHIDDDDAVAAEASKTGISIFFPRYLNGFKFNQTRGVARLQNGAADTDGTPVLQEVGWASTGITLGSEQALGFITVASGLIGSTAQNNMPLGKNGQFLTPLQSDAVSANPAPAGYSAVATDPPAVIVQQIVREPVAWFEETAPHSFKIVERRGDDLCWFNGQVTRGRSGQNVAVELGSHSAPYDAVIAADGPRDFTGPDGVERAINWLKSDVANALGLERHLKLHVRHGRWEMTRILHQFGLASEFATQGVAGLWDAQNNGLELIGEGPHACKIDTSSSDNASTTIFGNINIAANRIVLEGITFQQEFNAARPPRYLLHLEANEVILRNCHFAGGVTVKANRVTVEDCSFFGIANLSGSEHVIQGAAGDPYVAQHLRLEHRVTAAPVEAARWRVRNNTFTPNVDEGTHASVLLTGTLIPDVAPVFICDISHNSWEYTTSAADPVDVPAIHIDITGGKIDIYENMFKGASGVPVEGADLANTAAPFNGDYTGSPAGFPGGPLNTGNPTARAYISLMVSRFSTSRLRVHDNHFDLGDIGRDDTGRFIIWGAMITYPSTITGAGVMVLHNITFDDNVVQMGMISGQQWDGTQTNPVTFGFYLAPSTPDGSAITSFVLENCRVRNNHFRLGGESGVSNDVWRCIRNESIDNWPVAGTGYLTDPSCCIGIQLKNQTGGPAAATGRHAHGVRIENNMCQQGHQGAGFAPLLGTITMLDSDTDYYWSYVLVLHQGMTQSTSNDNPEGQGLAGAHRHLAAADYSFVACKVDGNTFWTQAYADATQSLLSSGGSTVTEPFIPLVLIGGLLRPMVTNNYFMGPTAINDGAVAFFFELFGRHTFMYSNSCISPNFQAAKGTGFSAGGTLHAANNMWSVLPDTVTGTVLFTYLGGSDGDNFNV